MTKQMERRAFRMHPHLLWDIITKQAGTIQKAILETVMNSIDAGATRCDIEFTPTRFSVTDDGKGFTSEEEIDQFFASFGTPHKAGDAVYGRFRMGRGQVFSFGVNKWASNQFRMHVDMKPQEEAISGDNGSLGFDYSAGHPVVNGCAIEVKLYEKLKPSAVDGAIREIIDYVRWAQIPVSINGKVISKIPSAEKWQIETPEAYINLREKGTLDVYNLGVLVCKIEAKKFGTGGTIVSKQPLEVNFARNEVIYSCPAWRKIAKHLSATTKQKAIRKPKQTDAEREYLTDDLKSGEFNLEQMTELRLITDVTGTHNPIKVLSKIRHDYNASISVAPKGDRVGETGHKRRLSFVLAQETLDRFDVETVEDFITLIEEIVGKAEKQPGRRPDWHYGMFHWEKNTHYPLEKMALAIGTEHVPVDSKDLEPAERLQLAAIDKAARNLGWYLRKYADEHGDDPEKYKPREVQAGSSTTALAWTDGTTTIWIDRRQLALVKEGLAGAMTLASLLLHEYQHNNVDTGSHVHDPEFYQQHHDIQVHTQIIGQTAGVLMREMIDLVRKDGKKPTGALARGEDRLFDAGEAANWLHTPKSIIEAA